MSRSTFGSPTRVTVAPKFLFLVSSLLLQGQSIPNGPSKDIVPVSYRLDLIPNTASGRFNGTEEIDLDVKRPDNTVTMNASGLDITTAVLKGENDLHATVSLDEKSALATLHFPAALGVGTHTLAIAFNGTIRPGRSGLFAAHYTAQGKPQQMLATQFEFSSARRVFPCWDDPSSKATFTLSVTLPAPFAAISNMPIATESPAGVDEGNTPLRKTTFRTTPRMSPYLLVLAAGNLEAAHAQAGDVALGVWTIAGLSHEGDAALTRARQLLPLYDRYFGFNYPLPKLDMIAVPTLGFEAMENWGGITFDSDQLLFDPGNSSPAALESMHHLEGHEIAHQWFGDLVTSATWSDVWLNESLAEWMSYEAAEKLDPREQPWLNFLATKKRAMDRDAGPTTSIVGDGFDANTSYRKGPAILRMLETYLGKDTFQRGIRDYIQAHAYGNATTADLWASLEKESGRPIAAIASTFTNQPGIPLIDVATACRSGETIVTLTQSRFTVDYPEAEKLLWQIPVVIGPVGKPGAKSETVVVDATPARLHFAGCALPVKANLGDTGYYHVRYDEANRQKLVLSLASLASADRVDLFTDQWALAESGNVSIGAYLDLTRELGNENSYAVWASVLDVLRQIDALERDSEGQVAFRSYARELVQPLMQRLGWEQANGEDPETSALRSRVISAMGEFDDPQVVAEANRRFQALLEQSQPLPPQLRAAILETVGRYADAATYDTLHRLAQSATSPEEKQDYYWAMASSQSQSFIDRTVAMTAAANDPDQDQFAMMLVVAAQRSDADRVFQDVEAGRQMVFGGEISAGLLSAIAEHAMNLETGKELLADPDFAAAAEKPSAFRQIRVAFDLRQRVLSDVARWLQLNILRPNAPVSSGL
jgi:aminopeptidase N